MPRVLPFDHPLEVEELSEARFPETWKVVRAGLDEAVASAFVVGLWEARAPECALIAAAGKTRYDADAVPVRQNTIFDLASVSKVVATAPLAAVLVERGWLSWNTPVAAIFPGYPDSRIELRHLLSHTAGFPAWQPLWERIRAKFAPVVPERIAVSERQAAMRELILAAEPEVPPGTRAVYSDISFLLLGFVLEAVTKMPLDEAVQRFVWDPMRITGFEYRHTTKPAMERDPQVAATEKSTAHGGVVLQGQVHDENCWFMGGYSGHAGVFGRAEDVLRFSRAVLASDFVAPKMRETMWSRVGEPIGCDRTLGWDTPSGPESSAGRLFSPRSVGHLGFTGTSLWIDPLAELAVTLLTNRVHPDRENIQIRALRPRLHEAIRRDIGR